MTDGKEFGLGVVSVGIEIQAEDFDGVVPHDTDYGTARGWASYAQPMYLSGRAALTRDEGASTIREIARLAAGRYRLVLRVYDDGDGQSRSLDVRLGGTTTRIAWAGGAAGPRWLEQSIATLRDATEVQITARSTGGTYTIVDALDLYPDDTPDGR